MHAKEHGVLPPARSPLLEVGREDLPEWEEWLKGALGNVTLVFAFLVISACLSKTLLPLSSQPCF